MTTAQIEEAKYRVEEWKVLHHGRQD